MTVALWIVAGLALALSVAAHIRLDRTQKVLNDLAKVTRDALIKLKAGR